MSTPSDKPKAELAEMVSLACGIEEGLTPWEVEFVDSVGKQWDERESLSERQVEILEALLEKHDV